MTKNRSALFGPGLLSLLAIAFCVWTALGNDVNICVTTGCTLFADATIFGISLWWFGAGAFTILAVCAILGQTAAGVALAAIFLAGDICLLILMSLTAPCVNCLLIALVFALGYLLFRRASLARQRQNKAEPASRSILLLVWLIFFIVNIGQVARSQIDVWPIQENSDEIATRMFFSPSCKYCVEGINALSGKLNVAFYPVTENDADVAKIEKMITLLAAGENMAEAVVGSANAEFDGLLDAWGPSTLLLRFRLLRNKAHLFAQGSQGVPFFEHKGLLPGIMRNLSTRANNGHDQQTSVEQNAQVSAGKNADMPPELLESGQCGGGLPCPPAQ